MYTRLPELYPSLQKRPRCCCKVRLRLPIIRTQVRKFPQFTTPNFPSHLSTPFSPLITPSTLLLLLTRLDLAVHERKSHLRSLLFSQLIVQVCTLVLCRLFFVESVLPNVPQVEEMTNLMMIATLLDGSVVQLDQFTRRMKEQIFDLLIARGLSSQCLPLDRLRHHIHPFVRAEQGRPPGAYQTFQYSIGGCGELRTFDIHP